MPNSDNQDGVFNKITKEFRYYQDEENTGDDDAAERIGENGQPLDPEYIAEQLAKAVVTQAFGGNIETAKSHFFHADALTNNDTNGTQLDYAITADGNGIKFTIAFGTKGTGTAEADDWAGTWTTTKDSLLAANKYVNVRAEQYWTAEDATPHLF